MTCVLGQDSNGNRFIACRRGDRRPVLRQATAIVNPESPWKIGASVQHKSYGKGKIVHRGAEWMEIDFDMHGVKRFIITLIGNNIQVVK